MATRRFPGKTAALILAIATWVGAAASCSSDEAAALRGAKLAQSCSLNSDCKSPLVCAFGRCHSQCNESRDCPAGQRCVLGPGGNVCQLPDETECTVPSVCKGSQSCGPDGECRDDCSTPANCTPGQVCVSSVCADPAELNDAGQLPVVGNDASAGGGGSGGSAGSGGSGGGVGGSGGGAGGPIVDAGQAGESVWTDAGAPIVAATLSGASIVMARSTGSLCLVETLDAGGGTPKNLASEAGQCGGLAVSQGVAYYGLSGAPFLLRAVPLSGGSPSTVLTTDKMPKALHVTATHLVWGDGQSVVFAPSGTTVGQLFALGDLLGLGPSHAWIAGGMAATKLQRCSLQVPAACDDMFPVAAKTDRGVVAGDVFYWAHDDAAGWVARLDAKKPGSKLELYAPTQASSIVTAGSDVYFYADGAAKAIYRVPQQGGSVTLLGHSAVPAALIGVSSTHVYFFEVGSAKILKLPK